MESLWETDTVVIGGGMAGILTAYYLQKQGVDVIVLEAKRVGSGQTGRTTAKITSQHGLFYNKLIKKTGRKIAHGYASANEEAIADFEKIISEEGIECNFERLPAILYTTTASGLNKLKKEENAARKLGIQAIYREGIAGGELPFPVKATLTFENQAQFHPLKFLMCLAEKLIVYEDTKVLSVNKHMVYTNKGNIKAENIVFATHYPFINFPGLYFGRQHQERSYVWGLAGQKKLSGMYYGIDGEGISLRSAGDMLLVGGGSHRTGKKGKEKRSCVEQRQGYAFLEEAVLKYYPRCSVAVAWAAQDCMPHDEVPFIGRYSCLRPYWYVATGFKKWGMTSSVIAAKLISDKICGRENPYEYVFKPWRFRFRATVKNLLIDAGESIRGLLAGLFSKKRHRCPHMGCRLTWNEEEASWDCPCHGSRFTGTGELRDNPAQSDILCK